LFALYLLIKILLVAGIIEIIVLQTLDHEILQVLPPFLALEVVLVERVGPQRFVEHTVHLVLVEVVFYFGGLFVAGLGGLLFRGLGVAH
jgi:hypothetical protein